MSKTATARAAFDSAAMFGIVPSYEVPESERPRAIPFSATITRREEMSILTQPGGTGTIGELIDSYFTGVAHEGGTVADFGLELSPQQFDAIYGKEAQNLRESERRYA